MKRIHENLKREPFRKLLRYYNKQCDLDLENCKFFNEKSSVITIIGSQVKHSDLEFISLGAYAFDTQFTGHEMLFECTKDILNDKKGFELAKSLISKIASAKRINELLNAYNYFYFDDEEIEKHFGYAGGGFWPCGEMYLKETNRKIWLERIVFLVKEDLEYLDSLNGDFSAISDYIDAKVDEGNGNIYLNVKDRVNLNNAISKYNNME